jgi:hypothetical protein
MSIKEPTGRLLDGVERNARNPQTFEIPSASEKASVRPGQWVKIGIESYESGSPGERFWVQVEQITEDGALLGRVDNDLEYTATHGVQYNDRLKLEPRHILSIHG